MASIVSNNYFDQHATKHHQYLPPRPPPSPPMEETTRCSLPSISNLLDLADAGSPKAGTTTSSPRSSPRSDAYASPALMNKRREPPSALPPYGARQTYQKEGLPPTPPQSTDMSFDNPRSPHRSQFSLTGSQSRQYYSRTPPLESDPSRRHAYAPIPEQRQARHDYHPSPLQHQQLARDGYHSAPRGHPMPPPQHGDSNAANGWEHHHHYLHPSQMALFPQSQDRYICPTCHKAFSRPSSLRIHSHSHTGEKPFKCPHPGCGKAFSVRSNMKRHERGCHGVGAAEGNAPASAYSWSATH